jgi:integrase/recombinase XerD
MSKRGNGYDSENRVNILKKDKVGKNWNLYPAVVEPNGKLRDKVRVRGKVEAHPEGYYYIEWWQDGRKREQIKDRVEVIDRARRKALELEANRAGIETVQEIGSGKGPTIAEAVASYLMDMEPPQREPKTYVAYKYCLELFAGTSAKRFVQDVKREHLLAFIRKLYELGCGPRTAYNRAVIVSQLLKANGIIKLLHNRDWPEYVEPIRPMYEEEEIEALLKACDKNERVLYLCYLLTGLRDKEMRYLSWRDIDFRTHVIRVTRKPLYAFKPKNKEEREVPVPDSLIEAVKKYKGSRKLNADALVFPKESGRPDKRHEFKLKRIAFHAKMNCGQCVSKHGNKCSEGPYCSNFFLHKFRHTFATRNLQDHVCDIKTLQNWMGHKDLASTMVYLKAVRNKDVMARVNSSEPAALAV